MNSSLHLLLTEKLHFVAIKKLFTLGFVIVLVSWAGGVREIEKRQRKDDMKMSSVAIEYEWLLKMSGTGFLLGHGVPKITTVRPK